MNAKTTITVPRPIPPEVLDREIRGRRLSGRTFGEELGRERTLLVFLRQLG